MRLGVASFTLLLLTGALALAKGPPQPLPDWPCETPLAGPLEAAMVWPGAADAPEGAWHDDPAARELVEYLSAPENSPAMGEREVADYAAKHGPVPRQRAQLIVSGLVERANILRRVLLKGIKQEVIRSHVLAEVVAQDKTKLAAAEAQAGSGDAAQLKEVLRQNLNGLDDAGDTAARLCHRLAHDEMKLRRVSDALRAHSQ